MRVLFIANDFPNPGRPAKGVFNLNLVRALASRHQVKVISPVAWTEPVRAIAAGAAEVWNFDRDLVGGVDGVEVRYPRYYYPPGVLRSYHGWCYWQSVRGTVESLSQAAPPDLVLAYWAHPDGEAAVRAARRAGARSAVIVGGSDVLVLTADPERRRRVVAVLQATDAVLCVSRHLRERVLALGIPADRVHLWHQGVDTAMFHPGDRAVARRRLGLPEAGPMALWVGRMVPVKGLDVLLDATARLHRRGLPVHVHLVGDGPLRERLESRVRALRLAASVSFAGSLTQPHLPDWYRAADVTVLPSRSEGLPNVLRESKACGTPFVASRVGGVEEIADEPWDQLVDPDEPAALAAALESALRSPRTASTDARSLSWSASAEALITAVSPRRESLGGDPFSVDGAAGLGRYPFHHANSRASRHVHSR
jgi:teichuronic acid biosynthesis glycosyltransferase TuaC